MPIPLSLMSMLSSRVWTYNPILSRLIYFFARKSISGARCQLQRSPSKCDLCQHVFLSWNSTPWRSPERFLEQRVPSIEVWSAPMPLSAMATRCHRSHLDIGEKTLLFSRFLRIVRDAFRTVSRVLRYTPNFIPQVQCVSREQDNFRNVHLENHDMPPQLQSYHYDTKSNRWSYFDDNMYIIFL